MQVHEVPVRGGALRTAARPFDVVVIGGGFSGALLCAQMLREMRERPLRIALVERGERVGPGLPYSTGFIDHLLNVPAERMSALPDIPDDFVRWLRQHIGAVDGRAFMPRALYGQYITDTLVTAEKNAPPGTLSRIRAEVTGLRAAEAGGEFDVELRDAPPIRAARVVLALGNARPANPIGSDSALQRTARFIPDPWSAEALAACAGRAPLLLIGTGLTSLDVALALRSLGQSAPVYALSRRGLLSHAHRVSRVAPPDLQLATELAEFLTSPQARAGVNTPWRLSRLLRKLRQIVRTSGNWRATVDQLRPLTNPLWQRMDDATRRRFLRHGRVYWDVHRHRAAPVIASAIEALQRGGAFTPLAGRITGIRSAAEGLEVDIRPRGGGQITTLGVARIINCTGPDSDLSRSNDSLVRSLLAQKLVTPDALGLGILTSDDGAAIGGGGTTSDRIFAIGALRRPVEWESTAVPELRVQASRLAVRLCADATPSRTI